MVMDLQKEFTMPEVAEDNAFVCTITHSGHPGFDFSNEGYSLCMLHASYCHVLHDHLTMIDNKVGNSRVYYLFFPPSTLLYVCQEYTLQMTTVVFFLQDQVI
jgi:hypothetical protein